jgi:hypothetical protein
MGIAKAKESLIGVPAEEAKDQALGYGSLDQALSAYRELAEKYPQSFQGEAAARRVTQMESKGPEIEKFYQQQLRAAAKLPAMPKLPDFK